MRQLERRDETKLAEFLRHCDHYRGVLKLNDKAGTDMFAGGLDPEEAAAKAPGKPAAKGKPPSETVTAMKSAVDDGDEKIRQTAAKLAEASGNGAERLHGLATVAH